MPRLCHTCLRSCITATFTAFILMSSGAITTALAKNWNDGTANWSPGTWSPAGAPTTGEAVNIVFTDGFPRTVTLNVSTPSLGLLCVDLTGAGTAASALSMPNNNSLTAHGFFIGGYNGAAQTSGRGAMTQSAGTTTVDVDLALGYGPNSIGSYTLGGTGTLTDNNSEYVGLFGNGTFNQSAGTNNIAHATGFFDIGTYAGSNGTYNLSGTSTLTVNTNTYVGDAGTGIFNHDGGTNTITGNLYLGNAGTGNGTYALSSGSLNVSGFEYVGNNGTGAFNQNGGDHTATLDLVIGANSGATGTYTLSAGSLTTREWEIVGYNGTGYFYQTGGTHIIYGNPGLQIGTNTGSHGTYSLSGDASVWTISADVGGFDADTGGQGVLTVSDHAVLTSLYHLSVINKPGNGLSLAGSGTIITTALNFNGAPALFNWTGGTLDLTTSVTFDSAATGTGAAFGPALTLGAGQNLTISGNEGLGGTGAFSLTLNSGATHIVGGTLTVNPTGTVTQNSGSTLNAATFIQVGGTVNGTLQNQGNFIYQSGPFNGRLLNQGTVSLGPNFTAPNGIENDTTLTVSTGQILTLNGAGLDNQGTFTLAGGTLVVNNMTSSGSFVFDSGTLSITGAGATNIVSIVSNSPNSTININADNVSIGNAASFTGFNHQGVLNVGANNVTLNSASYARLGIRTSLSGGTINAPNGVTFPSGSNFLGHGALNARLTGDSGAVIEADGALALGEAASIAGFSFGGELRTKQYAVTLNTSAIAGLGKLTTLGSGASPGTLNATNGFVVDFDEAVIGFGTINSTNTLAKHATINGAVQGTSVGQPITLSGYIKGTGTFTNVSFTGTFSPGLSPTIMSAGNLALASSSTLEMELGGTIVGTAYDEIQASGVLAIGGTLHISLINGFNPAAGNSFDILDWGSLSGTFGSIQFPTLANGLQWNTSQLYTTGVLSVASTGVPGDFNNNGIVDAPDYVVWRKTSINGQQGYNDWRANFGMTAGSGSGPSVNAAVPEPATAVLLMFAVGVWCLRRRRAA